MLWVYRIQWPRRLTIPTGYWIQKVLRHSSFTALRIHALMWRQLPCQVSLRCLIALWHGLDHIVLGGLRQNLLGTRLSFFMSNFLRVSIRAKWVLGWSGLRGRLDWAQIWIPWNLDDLCLARIDVLPVAFEGHEHNGEIVQRSIPSSSVEDLVSNESTDRVNGRGPSACKCQLSLLCSHVPH